MTSPDLDNRRRRATAASLVTLAIALDDDPPDPDSFQRFADAVCDIPSDDELRLTVTLMATLVARVLGMCCQEDAPRLAGADPRAVWSQFALANAAANWGEES